jgi:hypothetical protein
MTPLLRQSCLVRFREVVQMSGAISVGGVQAIVNFLFSRDSAILMLKSNAPDIWIPAFLWF